MDQPFLNQIAEDPNNDQIRLVYADYLEERLDPRAEFLKLEIQFNQAKRRSERDWFREELANQKSGLDPKWLLKVERTPVELCPDKKAKDLGRQSPAFCGSVRDHQTGQTNAGRIKAHSYCTGSVD